MDPHVYPDPQTAPLNIAAGATSALIPIEQLTTVIGTDPFMFIRVAMSAPACTALAAPAPTVSLKADTGDPVALTALTQAIYDVPGTNPANYIADVSIEPDIAGNNVFVITIDFLPFSFVAHTWQISIQNNHVAALDFTWVVSGTEANTIQPWIDVAPATLSYDVLINGSIGESVQIRNKGTGPFTVSTLSPALPASLVAGALPTVNPGLAQPLTITFTAPATPPLPNGVVSATETVLIGPPDDTLATNVAGHNHQVAITATTQALEVMMLLDDSGSMSWDPLGNPLPPGSPSSRWAELVQATNQFLNLLGFFGESRGRYGIARFPAENPLNPATFDIVPATNIPNVAGMAAAQGAVAAIVPTNGTPMGDGIDRVFAPATSYFNTDALSINADRRWLLLMTDGAQNSGTHNPTEYVLPPDGTAAAGTSLSDKNVELFAIGYGITGHSDVNPALLASLAHGSLNHGFNRRADDEGLTYIQVAQAFRDAIKSGITPSSSPGDPLGVFKAGQGQARYSAIITRYDGKTAFVLNWNTPDANRLRLELLTPTCELITPESAGQGSFADVLFRGGDRFQMYMVGESFVRNTPDPTSPRYGSWTLVISGLDDRQILRAAATAVDSEQYSYDIIVESDLRMELSLDQGACYAGDPIVVTARLTAEGKPVTGAMVSLSTTAPGQAFDNWLAGLVIPADAIAQAEAFLKGKDSTPLLVRTVAASFAGLTFDPRKRQGTLPMTDPGGLGIYQTTISDTSTPENYTFYVTAIGVTGDGVSFRREGKLAIDVLVRPDPAFTLLDVRFGPVGTAQVLVVPRDRFANVLLVDPGTFPSFGLTVQGGTFSGPLVSNLDGTYTRQLAFAPGAAPVVGVSFGGQVIQQQTLPPIGQLHWADEVIEFVEGAEAARGANQHINPQAALGDIATKPADIFVALGAGGALTLGFNGSVILPQGDTDITVVVHPTDDPRPYRVEVFMVLPDVSGPKPIFGPDGWVTLGVSAGSTQSFGLSAAHAPFAAAVRLTDLSRRTRGKNSKPLPDPGMCVSGLGALKIGPISAIGRLQFVDQVVELHLGQEAAPGANQHKDPKAALGDVAGKSADQFLSLGGFGSVALRLDKRHIHAQGEDDITVFVHPGQPLCSYLVEARPVNSDNWIPIGESTGVTQSFAFGPAGIQSASAIRITDRSGLIWGDHGEALTAPGTRLAGIGAKSVVKDEFFGGD
jgi:hypothetical protein